MAGLCCNANSEDDSEDPLLQEDVAAIETAFQAAQEIATALLSDRTKAEQVGRIILTGGPFRFATYDTWVESGGPGHWRTEFKSFPGSQEGDIYLCGDLSQVSSYTATYLRRRLQTVLFQLVPASTCGEDLETKAQFLDAFVTDVGSKRRVWTVSENGKDVIASRQGDFSYESTFCPSLLSLVGEVSALHETHEECQQAILSWLLGPSTAGLALMIKINMVGQRLSKDPSITLYLRRETGQVQAVACGRGSTIRPLSPSDSKYQGEDWSDVWTAQAASTPSNQPDPSPSAQRVAKQVQWIDPPSDGRLAIPVGKILFGDVELDSIPKKHEVDLEWLNGVRRIHWIIDLRSLRTAVLQACRRESLELDGTDNNTP